MPAPVLMYFLASLTALSLLLNALGVTLPFRFGSMDAGTVVRPTIYYIVEDVVAVDGNGGMKYREAFGARYDSSPVFRNMIRTLSVVWCLAFFALAAWFTVLVFTLPVVAVYCVGWAGPFPLAGMLALWTIYYVKACLREEIKLDNGGINATGGAQGQNQDERTALLSSEV